MQPFVLDASVVISFLLQERSAYVDGVFQKHLARGATAHVPIATQDKGIIAATKSLKVSVLSSRFTASL